MHIYIFAYMLSTGKDRARAIDMSEIILCKHNYSCVLVSYLCFLTSPFLGRQERSNWRYCCLIMVKYFRRLDPLDKSVFWKEFSIKGWVQGSSISCSVGTTST